MNTKTVALVCGVLTLTLRHLCLADIEPVSVMDPALANSLSANGYSAVSEMSPDGRYVVFESLASNLATNDYNYCADVFLRDRQSGVTILISANPDGYSGHGGSSGSSMSTNGAWIAFQSDADDLTASDDNAATDVFVRSITLGQTALVSVNTNGTSANGDSTYPIITPDGRFVAFESTATDLVTNNQRSSINVYLRDLSSNITVLASVSTDGLAGGNGDSHLSAVSSDGRYVLFSSFAKNIGAPLNSGSDIYLRDMQAQSNYWVSTNVARLLGMGNYNKYNANGFNPVMSEDGQTIVFRVTKDSSSLVLRHNLASNTTLVISSNQFAAYLYNREYCGPSISDDGGVVAYMETAKTATSSAATNQIYVWDSTNKTNTLVTLAPDGITPGSANSDSPVLSANGRALAFLSVATNLIANTPAETHVRVYLRDLATGVTKLANLETNLNKPLGDVFEYPILSADGSLVMFESSSDGLVDNDNNGTDDVFINNTKTGITELVSSRSPALDFKITSGSSSIAEKGLSRDGRFAVFSTQADTMVTGDTNLGSDIFVRDRATGEILLVSGNADGTGTGNSSSVQPSISADGSLVAFQSEASDLATGDTNGVTDVFLHDLLTSETRLVSAANGGVGSANGISDSPEITPDGRFVVFRSKARNLTAKTFSDSYFKLYACDTTTGTNVVFSFNNLPINNPLLLAIALNSQFVAFVGNASLGAMPFYLYDVSTQISEKIDTLSSQTYPLAAFSGDGRWLAYVNAITTKSNNLVLRDLVAKTNAIIGIDGGVWKISLNGDGSRVAYEGLGTSSMPTNTHQIFVFDTVRGSNILVSANLAGTNAGNGDSRNPILSPDGRFVYFHSHSTDLVADRDLNNRADVFVRDLTAGTTRLLSVNRFKTGSGNSQSVIRELSADGQVLAIESFASDFVPMDIPMTKDVFVVRMNATVEDSDNDGLADSWEMKYFGNLERNGAGDFDGDGMSDGAEYLAGTDPADHQSALIITQIGKTAEPGRLITWMAIPGKTYQIQYKTNLHDLAWENLEGTITADAVTASKSDDTTNGAEQRFYRVLLVP
jgi:hypothetical protein